MVRKTVLGSIKWTVVALFDAVSKTEQTIRDAISLGIPAERIGLVTVLTPGLWQITGEAALLSPCDIASGDAPLSSATGGNDLAREDDGIRWGGLYGLLTDLHCRMFPGVGQVVVAGPTWSDLAMDETNDCRPLPTRLASGIVGSLTCLGMQEEEAHRFVEGVRHGQVLLTLPIEDMAILADTVALLFRYDALNTRPDAALSLPYPNPTVGWSESADGSEQEGDSDAYPLPITISTRRRVADLTGPGESAVFGGGRSERSAVCVARERGGAERQRPSLFRRTAPSDARQPLSSHEGSTSRRIAAALPKALSMLVTTGILQLWATAAGTAWAAPPAARPVTGTQKSSETRPVQTVLLRTAATPSTTSLDSVLERAARLQAEAVYRSYTAPWNARYGYIDAANLLARMLSGVGQYERTAIPGSAGPADRTAAQRDVNQLWNAASMARPAVRAQRLRRAATLYAEAAGRFFAAEAREGKRDSPWDSGMDTTASADPLYGATGLPGLTYPQNISLSPFANGPRLYTPGPASGYWGSLLYIGSPASF